MDDVKALIEGLEMALTSSTKNRRAWTAGLRQSARGLWAGVFTVEEFNSMMFRVLNKGLTAAWNRGFMELGISPDEQDDTERQRVFNIIIEQTSLMDGLTRFITDNSKANGGKLKRVNQRVSLWEQRYQQVQNEAKARASGNKKLEWVLGVAEHCPSCVRLSGQVRRGGFWLSNGILPAVPGADYLECKGYKCKCQLKPTTKPSSRGKLPRLP